MDTLDKYRNFHASLELGEKINAAVISSSIIPILCASKCLFRFTA